MALAMGWRCKGELRPLTWGHVDWERGLVRLEKYKTKNDDARVFPFREAPAVLAALERRRAATQAIEQQTGTPVLTVFAVENGTTLAESRFYREWRAGWRKAFGKDAAPKRPHDFRRSAVRALETGGVPRSIAKRLVGHRTDSMYQRYAITTEEDLRANVRQLHQPAPAESE